MKYLAKRFDLHLLRQAVSVMLAAVMLFVNCPYVYAVSGPDVVVGSAGVDLGATTTVTMNSSKAVINWDSLDTQSGEILQFLKDSGNFAVLNRVMQGGTTQFDGRLFGPKGYIFFVNPQGIVFGPGASVIAGKFTASSLDISNTDFMSDNYNFAGGGIGEVANYGHISAEQVALIGKKVLNAGTISSPGGYTILAAGDRVVLGTAGSDVVVEVSGVTMPQSGDVAGLGDVVNEGTIDAAGGQIILAAGDTFSRAIDGIDGLSAAVESGTGRVVQRGSLSADGGRITLTAGDEVILADGSITSADAGQIIAYSPKLLSFEQGAVIRAGGGFVELSGLEGMLLAGTADLRAANGMAGTLLLDPYNITISNNFPSYSNIWITWLQGALGLANIPINSCYDITVVNPIVWSSQYGLKLDAGRDIFVNAGILNTGAGYLTLNADRHINVNAPLGTGGNLTLFADFDHNVDGDMHSGNGVTLFAGGNIDILGNDIILGGAVNAGGNLIITGRDCESPDPVWGNVWAKSTLTAGGNIEISDTGYWKGAYAPGTITLDGNVTASGGISLYNNTYARNITGNGVTLQAGGDIMLKNDGLGDTEKDNCTFLKGQHYLALIAGGTIQAEKTYIDVTGSTLKLQQSPDLDLKNFILGNQANTDLIANSTAGSVTAVDAANGGKTANAADKWKSVESTAYNNITLQGNGDIRAKALTSTYQGDISVKSSYNDVYGNGAITASRGNVSIKAYDDIELKKDVVAGGHISLTANGTVGSDISVDGKLLTKAGSGGDIEAAARRHISLNKTPGSATADGSIILTADSDNNNSGDLVVKGSLQAGEDIELSASDNTIILGGDYIKAAGNVVLNDNTELNGLGVQRIEATAGTLTAKQDIEKTKSGDMSLAGGSGIVLAGDVSTVNGDLNFNANVKANGLGGQTFNAGGMGSDLTAKGDISKITCGDLTLDASDYTIYLAGDVSTVNGDLNFNANVKANGLGGQTFNAGGMGSDLTAKGDISKITCGDLTLDAGRDPGAHIFLAGDVKTSNGNLTFEDDVIANGCGSQVFDADGYGKKLIAQDSITKTTWGNLTLDGGWNAGYEIVLGGDVTVTGGDGRCRFGSLYLGENGSYNDDTTVAAGKKLEATYGDVRAAGDLNGQGDLSVVAGKDITVYGNTITAGSMTMTAGNDIGLKRDVYAGTTMNLAADDDIRLNGHGGNTTAENDVLLDAGDDVSVHGNLASNYGSVTVDASAFTIHLYGDVFAADYIWLMANTEFEGMGDQHVVAGSWIQADGYLNKLNYSPCRGWDDGSLYLHAVEDISLDGYVSAAVCSSELCVGGGVSIISDTGAVFTPGHYVAGKPALAVPVTGRSDYFEGVGVDLPYGPGRAAIVIQSADHLMLHPDAVLTVCGRYYQPQLVDGLWDVDDRPGVGFLAEPANIGGYDRNQGEPFDAAIYVGSKNGNVFLGSGVDITSSEKGQDVRSGAMVADAWDNVIFGPGFEAAIAGGRVGDRLEVCSRITEWLEDAVGRLPYALGGGPFPTGYNYVLRGAGLENLAITDGRAWVLQSRGVPPAPIPRQLEASSAGCPVLMDAAAAELGVNTRQVAVWFEGGLEFNPDMQPCEACASLLAAAGILKDADGAHLAALNQVFNAVAPADMPFTPEMSASIATAFADMSATDSRYAMAAEYVDAFAKYVAILDTQLNAPMGDSSEFVLSKYGEGTLGGANTNVSAYIQTRLAQIGR